ncbi:MAG: sirohydrochlorin chelatase [Bryobacteraceae bacterium]
MASSDTAIIVFAHGSRIEAANAAVRDAARQLAQASGYPIVEAAFLELGQPDLPGAVRSLAAQGCRRFVVVPYFLTPGLHLDRDLPRLIRDISNENSNLEISVADSLDGHPALIDALRDRSDQALKKT